MIFKSEETWCRHWRKEGEIEGGREGRWNEEDTGRRIEKTQEDETKKTQEEELRRHTAVRRSFYTQTLLHTEAWHRCFYTQALVLVHTHRRSYTQKLLHTDAFHTEAFTHRRFYTQKLLRTEAFTHRCFYTQTLLYTEPLTGPTTRTSFRAKGLPLDQPKSQKKHQFLTLEPYFVRKGCRGSAQIAIWPQFLTTEPHFVRKGCRRSAQILPQFLTIESHFVTSFRAKEWPFRGASSAPPGAYERKETEGERPW